MKTIELKCTKEFIDVAEQDHYLSTPALIKYVIDIQAGKLQRDGGFSVDDIQLLFRFNDAIRPHLKPFSLNGYKTLIEVPQEFYDKTASIEIEDDDYEVFKKWIQPPFKWNIPAKFIIEFVNSFK